jgi:hypothetical protein
MDFRTSIPMIEEYKEFIGIYRDVTPEGYCQHMIEEFDRLQAEGMGSNRQQAEGAALHAKNDYAMFLESGAGTMFNFFDEQPVLRQFYNATQMCFETYSSKFSVLQGSSIIGTCAKMQKTPPGGGYHLWHGEQDSGVQAARVLTYMLYLNTFEPEEGGETEFLYQRLRLRPEANTMVVWPAAYTHAHRGNPVLGIRDKYVITGWFYYN